MAKDMGARFTEYMQDHQQRFNPAALQSKATANGNEVANDEEGPDESQYTSPWDPLDDAHKEAAQSSQSKEVSDSDTETQSSTEFEGHPLVLANKADTEAPVIVSAQAKTLTLVLEDVARVIVGSDVAHGGSSKSREADTEPEVEGNVIELKKVARGNPDQWITTSTWEDVTDICEWPENFTGYIGRWAGLNNIGTPGSHQLRQLGFNEWWLLEHGEVEKILKTSHLKEFLASCEWEQEFCIRVGDTGVCMMASPTYTIPDVSSLLSKFSLTLGISEVISSDPSFVSLATHSNSSIWIDVNLSSRTTFSDTNIESS